MDHAEWNHTPRLGLNVELLTNSQKVAPYAGTVCAARRHHGGADHR